MYIFRRAAARAVAAPLQIRVAPRVSSFQSSIPSLSRSFHQSRIWRAEEQKNETEATSSGSAPQSGISSDVDAVSESSGTTSEPLGQSEHQSESISEKASNLAQKAQETASDAAAKAAQAVGEFTPSTDKIQETASQVTESVQATASDVGRKTRDAADAYKPFKSAQPSAESPPTKILYVGNLFFEVTAPQLETEFSRYGEITNSRVVTDNRGLSKGFGYVEFANQEQANEALNALDQRVFQGRRLSVQYHKRRTQGNRERENRTSQGSNQPSKTLFIGNMSYQMSDKDLNDLFRQIKNVLDVRVAIDRRSGSPRGFAHADFIDVESASRAKEILSEKSVYGRQLRVDFSGQSSTRPDQGDRRDRGSRYERRDRDEEKSDEDGLY